MGVNSLSTFVTKIDGLRKDHVLRNTRLVIDGNNFMYQTYGRYNKLNNQDYLFAGNCIQLRKYFNTFFDNLAKCKIIPILVFDGSLNPDLEDNRRQRFEKSFDRSLRLNDNPPDLGLISELSSDPVFPFLLRKCFLSAAEEANVTILQTRQDSDLATARLANEFKCPLVSSDSDFLVMNIDEGVISVQTFYWENVITLNNKSHIECKIYKVTDFVEHFNLKPEMLPIFASIMGNDGIDGQIFDNLVSDITNGNTKVISNDVLNLTNGYFNHRFDRMNLILNWLSQKFFSPTHAIDFIKKYLQNNGIDSNQFLTSVQSYESTKGTFLKALVDHKENETIEELIPIDKMVEEYKVPKWFLMDFFHCRVDSILFGYIDRQLFLMRPLVEDFTLESCFESSYELNSFLLGILRLNHQDFRPMELVVRSGRKFIPISLKPKTRVDVGGDEELPILTELHKLSDTQKKDLLFRILRINKNWIHELREKLRLMKIDETDIEFWSYFLVVFKYWKHNTKLYLRSQYFTFVRALVLSIIYYRHHSLIRDDFKGLLNVAKNRFQLNITHYLNEFEVIYGIIDKLIALLGHPIKSVKLHHHLNGVLYYNLFEVISTKDLPFYAFKENRLNTLNTFIMSSL